MAAQTESQVVALELERVRPKFQTLFDRDKRFVGHIKAKDVEVVSYRQMRVPLEIRPGGNFGYFDPNGGDLGRGGAQQFEKGVLTSVFVREAIEYTKLTQWATNNSRKAIENSVRYVTAKAFDEFMRQLDAQYMGDGTGTIATVTTDTPAGGENVIVCSTDGFRTKLVRIGSQVSIFDINLTTLRGSGTVTYNDLESNTIKISPQIASVAPTDMIVVAGITAPTSLPALYGVRYHHNAASTGLWLGLDRATYPEVRASRVDALGAALSLPMPRLIINKIGNRVGQDNNFNPNAWTHPCQQQAYEEIGQLVSIIQKAAKEEGLNMFFSGDNMQLAGAPVKSSFNWDRERIDFVSDNVWGRGEILPIGFYKTDGRNVFEIRGASGGVATAEIFYLVLGTQTFVSNPAACAYIDNLAIPSGY